MEFKLHKQSTFFYMHQYQYHADQVSILRFLKEKSGSQFNSTSLDWKLSIPKDGQHATNESESFLAFIILVFFLLSPGDVPNIWKTDHSFVSESSKPPINCPSLHMAHSCCPSPTNQWLGLMINHAASLLICSSALLGHMALLVFQVQFKEQAGAKKSPVTAEARHREGNQAKQTQLSQKAAQIIAY